MSNETIPNEHLPNYREYLENKAEYSVSGLSHYFNGEMGVASNLIGTLRARIELLSTTPENKVKLLSQLNDASRHLGAAHEIANATFDLLITKEDAKS